MAVAGFSENDLDIEVKEGMLRVAGTKAAEKEQDDADTVFLHRGIASRNFERRFRLAEYVEVSGAKLENGLLHIDLRRELPDAMKPRKIEIASSDAKPQATIEARAGQVN
jgi:molecular chaperone IbpA